MDDRPKNPPSDIHTWKLVNVQHITEAGMDEIHITFRMRLPDGHGYLYWSAGQIIHVRTY